MVRDPSPPGCGGCGGIESGGAPYRNVPATGATSGASCNTDATNGFATTLPGLSLWALLRGSRIILSNASVQVETRRAVWPGKIMVYSTDDAVMELLDERVNKLPTPFKLEWHRFSGKPWDWKLVRVSNSAFEIPADIN